jgi:hypothetical protein
MLQARHPRRKIAIAALAIGFWSQVFLLRAWIHHDDRAPVPAPPPAAVARAPVITPLPPPSPNIRPVPVPSWRDPAQARIQEALQAARPAIKAHLPDLPRRARLDLRVDVTAKGRVKRMTITSRPDELSPAGRRAIERAIRAVRFPVFGPEDYTTEFPIFIAHEE